MFRLIDSLLDARAIAPRLLLGCALICAALGIQCLNHPLVGTDSELLRTLTGQGDDEDTRTYYIPASAKHRRATRKRSRPGPAWRWAGGLGRQGSQEGHGQSAALHGNIVVSRFLFGAKILRAETRKEPI